VAVGGAKAVAPTSPQYLIDCMGKINMHPFDQHDPNLCAPSGAHDRRDSSPYTQSTQYPPPPRCTSMGDRLDACAWAHPGLNPRHPPPWHGPTCDACA
jgi:hypothetical protein